MTILTLGDLSAKLVELESHPALEHLHRYTPTGATAKRWAAAEAALAQLWNDLAEANLDTADTAYAEIKAFLDAVDGINVSVAKRVAPSLKQLDATGAPVPSEITDLLAVSATDPLSLTDGEIDRRIADIAELVDVQTNWSDAVIATAESLNALRDAVRTAAEARERATQQVLTGPLPVSTDVEPQLRRQLDSMTTVDPTGLRSLQRRIESALERVRQDGRLAQGLLDRHAELKGRLKAYEAKAARLGLADDSDLVSARRIAAGLLSRRPCDLRAATQAVVDYQQQVSAKREETP
jgi:hypothetical protein